MSQRPSTNPHETISRNSNLFRAFSWDYVDRFIFTSHTYLLRCKILTIFVSLLCLLFVYSSAAAQQKDQKNTSAAASTALLTRTTTRHEVRRMGYGSTLTIIGAPAGSITIEAWPRSEVDITAEIELRAATEDDLTRLATVNGFVLDEDANHLGIITTGTHDKKFMRRAAKDFPKKLLGLAWKIDYRIRVPASIDLEINAGSGPLALAGVEGFINIKALESDAVLTLTGGAVQATVGGGSIKVNIATRSWRGAGASISLATGTLTVELPAGFNADIGADILRTGQIENNYANLKPLERTTPTPRSLKGRAGSGGATLSFTVGDGTLRIKQKTESGKQ